MIIILTIQESERQIIAGFPEYITLTTNVPSTIFYTLDGSDPDENSEIFVTKLVLPLTGLTLTLKAMAVSNSVTSAILEKTYLTDQSNLDRARLIGKEGINLLPPDSEVVDHLSFDQDGNEAQTTSIDEIDLDLIASTRANRGQPIPKVPGGTTVDFINFPLKVETPTETIVSYLNRDRFNPRAAFIIIDGTSQNAIDQQIVRVVNRPSGSMDLLSRIHTQNMSNYQLNTANFVRSMLNPKTGKMTFYYRDSRENRWIRSDQQAPGPGLNLSFNSGGPPSSFVFRWIDNRTQTRIY